MNEELAKTKTYDIFGEDGTPFAFDISYEDLLDWAQINNLTMHYKNDIPFLARENSIVGTKYRIEAVSQ